MSTQSIKLKNVGHFVMMHIVALETDAILYINMSNTKIMIKCMLSFTRSIDKYSMKAEKTLD